MSTTGAIKDAVTALKAALKLADDVTRASNEQFGMLTGNVPLLNQIVGSCPPAEVINAEPRNDDPPDDQRTCVFVSSQERQHGKAPPKG